MKAPYKAELGFGDAARMPAPPDYPDHSDPPPLAIAAWTANGFAPWTELLYGRVNTTVAGRPARYYTRDGQNGGSAVVPPGGSVLLVEIGSCGIQITVRDRNQITRADMDAMFTDATFDKCDSTRTWTHPLD